MADINSFRKISFNPFRKKGIVMGVIAVGAIGVISVTSVLVGQRQDLQQKASENNDVTISGNVYYDQNLSGSYDAGDILLNKNFEVIPKLMPEMTGIDPDQNGFYSVGLPKVFNDYQVSVNGGSNLGGKSMMTLVGDGSGYFVNSQQSGEHKNLDFGVIYQTPHLGPQNTCMIKIIVQRQPLVERRGNVTATVAIFTNKTKPQNVDVSFEGNLLPDQKNPRLDLSFFDSNVVALPNPISSLIQGTSDGMVKCTVTDQISGQTLDTKYVKYRFVFDHGAKDIQILDDQGGNYPIPKFSDIPQMQAIQNGNNLNESSITGVVFYDQNMNGVKDPGEPTVDGKKYGLQIRLTGRKDDVQDVGSEGTYTFTNLKREGGYYELQPLAKFDGQANLALFTTTPYRFDAYYWQNDKNVNFGIIFNNPNSGPSNNCQVRVAPQALNQFPYAQLVNLQFPVIVTTNKNANTSVEVVSESPKLYPVPGNPWVIPLRDDSYVGGINFAASYIVSSNNDTGSVTISCVVKDKLTSQVLFKNSANVGITRTNMGNAVSVAYPQDSNYTIPPLTTQSQSTPTVTPTATVAITQTPTFTLTPSLVPTKPNTPTPTKRITPTPTRVSFPTRRPLPTKTPTPTINRNNCRVADLNCDGKVDEADFNLFLREYNNSRNQ